MTTMHPSNRTSGVVAIAVVALMVASAGGAWAQARIDGISGTNFNFTAKAGEVSTPDGGSVHFWGYQDLGNGEGVGLPQYPGPTVIVNQNADVTITLTSELPFAQCTSMVFPGHAVSASGGSAGLLTQESCNSLDTVTYSFTASEPGTYTYSSGTQAELQIEMGLVGTIIVRPNAGEGQAYNDPGTAFDHEYLFVLTQMDPLIHQLAEQGKFNEIDMTSYWPVYWFINGRAGPDTLAQPFVAWLPHQPYNALPRMSPGENLLMRLVGGDQGQHPFHFHGNNADVIARDGRMLTHPRSQFTTLSVPGQTFDQIFTWTGKNMGWDIYGTPADGALTHTCVDVAPADGYADAGADYPMEWCEDHYETCTDTNPVDGRDDTSGERCKNGYTKALPVELPEAQSLAFGGFWSGSPFMGDLGTLPPGEGGLNAFGGFFFMWHSHSEKELANFDIFPGGMLSMMVVEPPGTPIP